MKIYWKWSYEMRKYMRPLDRAIPVALKAVDGA